MRPRESGRLPFLQRLRCAARGRGTRRSPKDRHRRLLRPRRLDGARRGDGSRSLARADGPLPRRAALDPGAPRRNRREVRRRPSATARSAKSSEPATTASTRRFGGQFAPRSSRRGATSTEPRCLSAKRWRSRLGPTTSSSRPEPGLTWPRSSAPPARRRRPRRRRRRSCSTSGKAISSAQAGR